LTFSLTEECLFCHKKRVVETKELWETKLLVFFNRKDHHPDDKVFPAVTPPVEHRFGWVVTVCRACRKARTVDELITAAKEIF